MQGLGDMRWQAARAGNPLWEISRGHAAFLVAWLEWRRLQGEVWSGPGQCCTWSQQGLLEAGMQSVSGVQGHFLGWGFRGQIRDQP